MTSGRLNQYGTLIVILLIVIIAVGGIVTWSSYSQSQPVEILVSSPPSQGLPGEIYIGGAVSNPGFYPLKADDTIEALIQAAGGVTSGADLTELKLYISKFGEEHQPQKINLNRAEVWLLEALPGIGETRAQAILDYRLRNGPFQSINELTMVAGIGPTTYEKIKHLITVAD